MTWAPLDTGYLRVLDIDSGELIELSRESLLEALREVAPREVERALGSGDQVGNWTFNVALHGKPATIAVLNSECRDAFLLEACIHAGFVPNLADFKTVSPRARAEFVRSSAGPAPKSGQEHDG